MTSHRGSHEAIASLAPVNCAGNDAPGWTVFTDLPCSGKPAELQPGDRLLMSPVNDDVVFFTVLAAGLVPSPPGIVPATRYTVAVVTPHLTTNAEVLRRFLDVEIAVEGKLGEEGEVRVLTRDASASVVPLTR